MIKIFLSPSTQDKNEYTGGSTEEIQMNLITDELCRMLDQTDGFFAYQRNNPLLQYSGAVKAANEYKPDCIIAIHSNAGGGSGCEVFCYNPKNAESIGTQLSNKIYNRLSALTIGPDRGVKKGTFAEITKTKAPCVYVEIEYHDNAAGANWIKAHRKEIAAAIFDGICEQYGYRKQDLKIGDLVTINGVGYPTSYGEGAGKIIQAAGKIINIYEDGRKCPYAVNYTNLEKSWVDRYFSKNALK